MNIKRLASRAILSLVMLALLIPLTIRISYAAGWQAEPGYLNSIQWSPDGNRIAGGASNGMIYIWDVATGQLAQTLSGHTDSILRLAWSRDGSKLASGSADYNIRIWDTATGKLLNMLTGYESAVSAVTWSLDGSKIISGSVEDKETFRVWDSITGQLLESRSGGTITELVWSPDGSKLAAVGVVGIVNMLDEKTLKSLFILAEPESSDKNYDPLYNIGPLAWNPSGNQIATGSLNGAVRIWDMEQHRILFDLRGNNNPTVSWTTSGIQSLTFSADGSKLSSISSDGTMRIWNTTTGQVLETKQVPGPTLIYGAAWSRYGIRLATGSILHNIPISGQTLADSGVQILVPFPSLDELQAITKQCVAQPDVQQKLTSKADTAHLPEFIGEVNKLSKEQLPTACAADLLAVANALQGKP